MVCAYKLLNVRKKFLNYFKTKEIEWHLLNPKTKSRQGYEMSSNNSHHKLIKN